MDVIIKGLETLSEQVVSMKQYLCAVFVADHWSLRGGGDYRPPSGLLQGADQSGGW